MKFFKFSLFTCLLLLSYCGIRYVKNNNNKRNNQNEYIVNVITNVGPISFRLLNETPIHRDNLIKLVNKGFYDGIDFHRVVEDFVIQVGAPDARGEYDHDKMGDGDIGYTLKPEIIEGLKHYRGAVGMAREGDDINPDRLSSGSHFYIIQGPQTITDEDLDKAQRRTGREISQDTRLEYKKKGGSPHLDGDYTIFGYVIKGMSVVDSIAKRRVNDSSVPYEPITIEKIFIEEKDNNKSVSFEAED